MEPDDGDARGGLNWPTKNVFWNITVVMVVLGVLVCLTFPLVTSLFGVSGEPLGASFAAKAILVAAIGAGLPIGAVNYLLVTRVVRDRMVR